MDAISLSLDEIIKKKSIGKRTKNGKAKELKRTGKNVKQGKPPASAGARRAGPVSKKPVSPNIRKKKPEGLKTRTPIGRPKVVVDARMKIIQKKRAHIRDARDKLIEIARTSGDARLRLLKRKGNLPPGDGLPKKSLSGGKFRGDLEDDFEMEVDLRRPIGPLKRTVRNEMFTVPSTMPPLPTFSRHVRNSPPPQTSSSWNSDPFDCYEVHTSRPTAQKSHAPVPLPHYDDLPPRRNITRARSPPPRPMYAEDRPHLSSTMRARLERAPNQSESMGIFAKMPPDDHYVSSSSSSSRQQYSHHHHHHQQQPQSPSPSPPISGYRIVVSNLHSSVTQNDIKELFEDIGDLLESRLVRPGVAEVIYRTLKDAEEAVDTYHNRQLDGQPMKCLLVKPRSSNKPTAPAISYSSSSRSLKPSSLSSSAAKKSQVEIDIDALHTVLFRRDH
ncbi:polymerase delta-interacting protein 3 [Sabethes cyaneus]|uniref:polymerase delta-interacting protein 3 n=1 Tax=Sabethes cyaneus TaxID=53552 RepID=UPI00237D57AD|nr:polymerase delta-interacting protein 3 [Sabethes cyaneus]